MLEIVYIIIAKSFVDGSLACFNSRYIKERGGSTKGMHYNEKTLLRGNENLTMNGKRYKGIESFERNKILAKKLNPYEETETWSF